MKLVSQGDQLSSTIISLLKKHTNFSFAVAWAGKDHEPFRIMSMREYRSKIHQGVIGTHFHQTHPDVLDAFTGSKVVRFIMQPKGVFHPKAYLFWTERKWDALVGSANFTKSAMESNQELMLHISSACAPLAVRKQLCEQIQEYWESSEKMTQDKAKSYRGRWKERRKHIDVVSSLHGAPSSGAKRYPVPLLELEWDGYVEMVCENDNHCTQGRCKLLKSVRKLFEKWQTFHAMPVEERKLIAGMNNKLDNDKGKWFGAAAYGDFMHLVKSKPRGLSEALKCIPLHGDVKRSDYDAYRSSFDRVLPIKKGLASLTRLLAMKRPDYFVCVDKENKKALCDGLAITAAHLDSDSYWDCVVCRVRQAPWWLAPAPKQKTERGIWENRVAMLDAIYYVFGG